MVTKYIRYNSPFNSQTFNDKDSLIVGQAGPLSGFPITTLGTSGVSVGPGTFIYQGIIVSTEIVSTVVVSGIPEEGYLIATTPNSVSDTYVLIVASNSPAGGAVIATWNGTEWINSPYLTISSAVSHEDRVFTGLGHYANPHYSCDTLTVNLSDIHTVFPDGNAFISPDDPEDPITYEVTLVPSTEHYIQHSICAWSDDDILKINDFPAGTLFASNSPKSTKILGANPDKIEIVPMGGDNFAVVLLSAGTLWVSACSPDTTSGEIVVVRNTNSVESNINRFSCLSISDTLLVAYSVSSGNTDMIFGNVHPFTGTDITQQTLKDTNEPPGSLDVASTPMLHYRDGIFYLAWVNSGAEKALYLKTFRWIASESYVPQEYSITTTPITSSASLTTVFDFSVDRTKLRWTTQWGISSPYRLDICETNLYGALTSSFTSITTGCDSIDQLQMEKDSWGNLYTSWTEQTEPAEPTAYIVIDDVLGVTRTYSQIVPDISFSDLQLNIYPMKHPSLLTLNINVNLGSIRESRLNFLGEEQYTTSIICTDITAPDKGAITCLESGAAAVAISTAVAGGSVRAAYIPTASQMTEFVFPDNGLELVRATTTPGGVIETMVAPNDPLADGVTVAISTSQISKKYVDPYGGIQKALAVVGTPTESTRAIIEVSGGKHYLLTPIVMKDYVELRGKNPYITTQSLFSGSNLITGASNSIIDSCEVSGVNVSGIYFNANTNFMVYDNVVKGSAGIRIASCTNYIIDRNNATSTVAPEGIIVTG